MSRSLIEFCQYLTQILGTVGVPLPETEIRIVDPVNGVVLPVGIKGVVQARGPQIMIGYFKVDFFGI